MIKVLAKKQTKSFDGGLTLVEILISLIILGTITAGISALISNSSTSLEKSSENNIATRQALRLVNLLRNDVSGSFDLEVFSSGYPYVTCAPSYASSQIKEAITWFRVDVKEISEQSGIYDEAGKQRMILFSLIKSRLVNEDTDTWYVARSVCDPELNSFSISNELILKLGEEIEKAKVQNQQLITCNSSYCPLSSSTSETPRYSIRLPAYPDSKNRAIRNLVDGNLSDLTSRLFIDERVALRDDE